jgi:hypothetical protein
LRKTPLDAGDDSRPSVREEPLSENAPEPAGYEAGLGTPSREERYCDANDAPLASRSLRLIIEDSHRLRL